MYGIIASRKSKEPQNDGPQIEELYDQYSGVILDHCTRILKDRFEAEDAMQETFVKAYRYMTTLRDKKATLSWMYRIATNECLLILRTRRRKGVELKEDIDETAGSQNDQSERAAARQMLAKLADKFDDRDFIIVVEHYLAGMEQGEIAESLGLSRRAVVKRLTRLRSRAEKLGKWGALS